MERRPRGATNSTGSKSSATTEDYVARAIAYAEEAIEDRKGKRYGQWIRLAARRFIADLKRAQGARAPFHFSADRANLACSFIEKLPHVEGRWASPMIRLEPAQIFFVAQLFGFRNLAGKRRFTTALFAVARKNAKSTLAAAILLYCLCCEREPGPQLFTAATTGDQARIVWSIAKRMVERKGNLREAFGLEAFANTIVRYQNAGSFRPINAKASTQDGLNPYALCFDELHAHRTHDLLNVLLSAAGGRDNPLFLYTTTEGYETPGPWPEIRSFAIQLLRKVVEADHFLAVYYAIDEKDDEFDERAWIKANPLIETNPILLAAIRKESIEAKAMPGRLAEFRIKRLNRPSASGQALVDLHKWNRCAGPVDLDALQGIDCWAAFDLASTTDMTAWRLLWQKNDRWYTWGRYWVPREAVAQRTIRGTVPYAAWVTAGYVTQTDGDVTDYDVVKRDILADYERFSPREIAFDPWNAVQLANELTAQGLPLVQFIQGTKSYHPAMQAFEREYTGGQLNHGGDPVLRWNVANLVARRDANANLAPDRKRSADKIDGAVALLMCFGRAIAASDSLYTFEGLTVA